MHPHCHITCASPKGGLNGYDRLSQYAAIAFGKEKKGASAWYHAALRIMGVKNDGCDESPKKRKGGTHAKKCDGRGIAKQLAGVPKEAFPEYETAVQLMAHVAATSPRTEDGREAQVKLIKYIVKNAYRMDYGVYRTNGFQIGSGAMEAMHRTAGHSRLKVSGARWLETTSQAVFNWRMLRLNGRWDEFWSQTGIEALAADAFRHNRQARNTVQEREADAADEFRQNPETSNAGKELAA